MSPVHLFNVVPVLPAPLEPLCAIAKSLIWAWDPDLHMLFQRIDPNLFEETNHNPTLLLGRVRQERLNELAADDGYLH